MTVPAKPEDENRAAYGCGRAKEVEPEFGARSPPKKLTRGVFQDA
jgi:hypothetical protein